MAILITIIIKVRVFNAFWCWLYLPVDAVL